MHLSPSLPDNAVTHCPFGALMVVSAEADFFGFCERFFGSFDDFFFFVEKGCDVRNMWVLGSYIDDVAVVLWTENGI